MATPKIDEDGQNPAYLTDVHSAKPGRLSRDELMDIADDLIRFLHARTMSERFREQKGDKLRLAYARVELSAIQGYAGLLKDEEIEELTRRVEILEEVKGVRREKEEKR